MNPRWAFFLTIAGMVIVIIVLCVLFPVVFDFVKAFSGELRFFWWVILLLFSLMAYVTYLQLAPMD